MEFTISTAHAIPFVAGFFYAWRFDTYFLGVGLMLIWAAGFMDMISQHVTLLDAIVFYMGMSLFELINYYDIKNRIRW